ncbi:MAG: hypothetical protein ACI8R4_003579 [Paracoccaceae bacterium]
MDKNRSKFEISQISYLQLPSTRPLPASQIEDIMLCFPIPNGSNPTPVLGLSAASDANSLAGSSSGSLDSETAALIRAVLRPLFECPDSWFQLTEQLRNNGYSLAFRAGRLCLTDHATGNRLCSLRFLGIGLRDLVARLGRPVVRPLPGRPADGELLTHA